jgi:hypothetical protein
MYKLQPYFFIALMWKKQAPEACFNLKLVLLLSPESLADYALFIKNQARFIFPMHNKECIK